MTPGIIFNSEHLIVYGEYDDGKIRDNEEFKNEIKPLMNNLGIVNNDIINEDGTLDLKNYLGHPEIKGVRGVDKRKYLFDLVHIFPRDLNFDDPGALISPELIREYRSRLINDYLQTPDIKEKLTKIQLEVDAISKSAKDPKELMKNLEKPFEEREAIYFELENKAKEATKLNTVYKTEFIATNVKEEEIKTLENIAKFIKEEVLEKALSDNIKEEDVPPCESNSLQKYFNNFGITYRYFGQLINKIDSDPTKVKKLSWLKSLIQREMLVQSAGSVFNSLLKNTPSTYSKIFTSYFLNIFLGHPNQIKALDYFNIQVINGNTYKFIKPEVLSKKDSGENSPINTTSNSTKITKENKDDKNKKKRKKRSKGGNKAEINVDFKNFLFENLVGTSVNGLIETSDEVNIFVKPSEVSKNILFIFLITRFGKKLLNIVKLNLDMSLMLLILI